jgi:hypothetical protein
LTCRNQEFFYEVQNTGESVVSLLGHI